MLKVAERPPQNKPEVAQFRGLSEEKRAHDWLVAEVAAAQRIISTQLVTLTPALARVLLERNPENRSISENYVDNFARDIANDAWKLNGEPIIVSRDGLLNDGQHRCHAVIRADKSINVVLVVGAERDTRLTLDQGRTRLAGDYLAMNGHDNAVALAAVAGFVFQYQGTGSISRHWKSRPTRSEVLQLVEHDHRIVAALDAVPRKGSDNAGGRSTLAFCYWVFAQKAGSEAAAEFIASLLSGANLLSRDPILYARNRLITERTRLSPNEKAELIFRAWNSHRRREAPRSLPILNGPLPIVES